MAASRLGTRNPNSTTAITEALTPLWMEYAVGLEDGDYALGDMPLHRQNDELAIAASVHTLHGSVPPDDPHAQAIDRDRAIQFAAWKKIIEQQSDDPLKKIIDHWSEARRRQ